MIFLEGWLKSYITLPIPVPARVKTCIPLDRAHTGTQVIPDNRNPCRTTVEQLLHLGRPAIAGSFEHRSCIVITIRAGIRIHPMSRCLWQCHRGPIIATEGAAMLPVLGDTEGVPPHKQMLMAASPIMQQLLHLERPAIAGSFKRRSWWQWQDCVIIIGARIRIHPTSRCLQQCLHGPVITAKGVAVPPEGDPPHKQMLMAVVGGAV
jgi:(2Fe-2S) ferredoxin